MDVHVPSSGHGLALFMRSNASTNATLGTDPMCSAALATGGAHFVSFTADGGPRVLTVLVDGKLCDGGGDRVRGWEWFSPAIASVRGERLRVFSGLPGLVVVRAYDRPLSTSEAVANWRAGPDAILGDS